jgi:hypothetical protein
MKTICLTVALALNCCLLFAQPSFEVAERTIKIPAGTEELMYLSFHAGDQILLDFEEVDGKELKEVEVLEYPSTSRFMDYKTVSIREKRITVNRTAVHVFRFQNSHMLSGRVCKVKVSRIPSANAPQEFNTSVDWKVVQDTSWRTFTKDFLIGYDTLRVPKTRRVLVKTQLVEELLVDKIQRVHSITNSNGPKTSLFFSLPSNSFTHYEEKRVISWVYWIGVGEESNAEWQKNSKAMQAAVKGAAGVFLTPLGALAAGLLTDLAIPSSGLGEDVEYGIVTSENKTLWYSGSEYRGFDFGKGVAGFKKFTDPSLMQGTFYVIMENDNVMTGIDATVRVSALIEVKTFDDEAYVHLDIKPKYEQRVVREPTNVKTSRVPILH